MALAQIFAETQRTTIEKITLSDAPFFLTLVNSPGWLQFIGDRNINNEDDARRYLENGFLRSYEQNRFGYYIIIKKETQEPIGTCGFLKKPSLENPDFGFAFLPDYSGQGYAFESCQAALEFGIQAFNFDVLDAVTMPNNERSILLLQRLGFRRVRQVKTDPADDELVLFRWSKIDDNYHGEKQAL